MGEILASELGKVYILSERLGIISAYCFKRGMIMVLEGNIPSGHLKRFKSSPSVILATNEYQTLLHIFDKLRQYQTVKVLYMTRIRIE